jgi:hypothetical protein
MKTSRRGPLKATATGMSAALLAGLGSFDSGRSSSIPRLYSAAELGAIYSWGYQGGGNTLEFIVFGHIAGERAAA